MTTHANPDPRELGPRPPFKPQQQRHPGTGFALDPPADHGDESYTGHGLLTDRVAIITGGDSGIGRAVATAFSKEGADIVLSYLPEEQDDAQEVAAAIEKAGRKAVLLPGDIGDPAYTQSLVKAAIDTFGRLDILINNAGFQMVRDDISEVTPEELEHTSASTSSAPSFSPRPRSPS